MKKILFIAGVLSVAVFSTACVNNLAVQELNNKAKIYADKGDYPQAIERLKSSIDLDPTVYETRYNLAVVYTLAEDYVNAVDEYKKVMEIKSDVPDLYYSLATAENNLAVDIRQGKVKINPADDSLYTATESELEAGGNSDLSEKEALKVRELYKSALSDYREYIKLSPNAKDKSEVEEQIKRLENVLEDSPVNE